MNLVLIGNFAEARSNASRATSSLMPLTSKAHGPAERGQPSNLENPYLYPDGLQQAY